MNKKLVAVAVAGALAAPGIALAQSSVTISGVFKQSLQYYQIDNAAVGRLNNSQVRITDEASKIIFGIQEDLGRGLSAIAQLDIRFYPNTAVGNVPVNPLGSGNTWVGLKSSTLGTMTIGRHDLHYSKSTQDTVDMGGALQGSAVTIVDYGKNTSMYNVSRTQNSIKYTSPNLYGVTAIIAYSPGYNSTTAQGDMVCAGTAVAATACSTPVPPGTNNRKGSGWIINPEYAQSNFMVGWSYLNVKPDLLVQPTADATVVQNGGPGSYSANPNGGDKKSNQLYGYYKVGGFKIGGVYNDSQTKNSSTGAQILKRKAWAIPASYSWGPNHIAGHYAKAGNNTGPAGEESDTGANQQTIAYIHDLSKRTKVAVTYSRVNNQSKATYNPYTNTSFASADVGTQIGEKPKFLAFTVTHNF